MSRRGNGHENAVAEGFFRWFKRARVHRLRYLTLIEARRDVFDCIARFHSPIIRRRLDAQDRTLRHLTHSSVETGWNPIEAPHFFASRRNTDRRDRVQPLKRPPSLSFARNPPRLASARRVIVTRAWTAPGCSAIPSRPLTISCGNQHRGPCGRHDRARCASCQLTASGRPRCLDACPISAFSFRWPSQCTGTTR